MKIRITVALVAVFSLVLAAVAFAAQTEYKVTGGGQTFAEAAVGSDGKPTAKGPGDTITFQAFIEEATPDDGSGPGSPATGQVNIIDRTAGATTAKGKGVHYKGEVTCAYVMPESEDGRGYAELHGIGREQGSDTTTPFIVRIQDNGQGASAENDLVEFDRTASDPTCQEDADDSDINAVLARGNAKIHKANPSNSGSAKSSQSTSLLRALR